MPRLSRTQRLSLASQALAQPVSVPAPITGWNARDALDEMAPTDAVLLDNWYPDAQGVTVRNGFAPYATGTGTGPVRTLAEHAAGASRKFIAAASGKFYDISAAGPASAPLASGFAGDAWQWVPFLSRLFFVNGTDTAQVFDGTSFGAAGFTGVSLASLVGVAHYQQRLFFWQNNSTGFWFAPLNSISGALSFYELAGFAPHGGNLVAVATFSHDGGNGVADFVAFIMSSGDCLIYFGNDPGNANAWSLVGIYRISPPVGPRAVCQYGAEAFLTTCDDHIPLQQQLVALKLGQLPPRSKVSTAVANAVRANQSAFGWQALYYPRGRRLIFNVPNPDGTFSQHIQNTALQSQPWCRFVNMNAHCWGLFRDNLFFGAAGGNVYQADIGNLDNLGAVAANAQQAWNTFADPMRKRITAVRPMVQALSSQNYSFGIGFDYGDINIAVASTTTSTGSPWDTSPWDVSPWSPDSVVDPHWRVGGGTGQSIGVRMIATANSPMTWLRTDFRFEQGSGL
jgi:hypothetical protein